MTIYLNSIMFNDIPQTNIADKIKLKYGINVPTIQLSVSILNNKGEILATFYREGICRLNEDEPKVIKTLTEQLVKLVNDFYFAFDYMDVEI